MAPYLIIATALELTYFTTLLELNFDFWVFIMLQKYSFPTFSFISKFLNLSAFNAPKYSSLSLHLQCFSWLHHLVAIYFLHFRFSMPFLAQTASSPNFLKSFHQSSAIGLCSPRFSLAPLLFLLQQRYSL